ncbi:recombinase family protein [Alterileibacterium massiliense]|uniref:recombinase family protein n=1 Tax=Alterileibacterium massiliense TaxID=1870997 RepID=UPI0008DB08FE|nr:recombinase family protein [Alterileibacterium massiliense]
MLKEESRSISENTTWGRRKQFAKGKGSVGFKHFLGKDKWHISTIRSILTNEKYKGDAIWQKQYTSDFLQKTVKENKGEIPKYYVEEHHKAIIQPEQFDYIQAEIERRKNGTSEISGAEGEPFHAP